MRRRVLSLAAVLVLLAEMIAGQDHTPTKVNNQNRTGPLPFSTSIGTDIESVDIPTGKLRVNIPIVSVPGRGMDSSFYLRFDSLFWVSPAYVGPQQELVYEWKIESNGGLFPDHGIGWNINQARVTNGSIQFPCNGQTANYATNYIYHDPEGGKHPLAVKGATASPCAVQDWNGPDLGGQGIWAKKANEVADPEIYLADGTRFVEDQNWRDPNGNTKSVDPTGLDTLGRNIVTRTSNASQVFYHVTDSNGQQQTYTVNFGSTPLSTAFNIPAPNGNGNIREFGNPTPFSRRVLSSVVLPNGQSYQFQYESGSYGGITRIDLPTGAFITYTWTTIVDGSKTHRAVASRTVNVGGQSHTWTFEPGLASSKVTDPLGKQSVFTHMDGVVTNVKNYDGAATGNPMREYLVDHVWDADPWDGIMPPSETLEPYEPQKVAIRPIRITTKFPEANLINKKEFDYETFTYPYHPNFTVTTYGQLVNFTTSRGNVTEIREFDWGIGTPGALLRRITKAYLHNANGAYTAKNIVSKVLTETIFDGGGAQKAQTQLEYDSTAVISTSSAPQHDYTNFGSGFTTRGNATKVKRWLNTTGGLLTTTYNYDDLGNIRSISDPLGHETSYSYTDDFSDSINRNAQAYLTQVTFPQTNGISHIEKRRYFFPTAQLQRSTDQNNQHTTFTYDFINRPLEKNFPDGGQTKFLYGDTPNQVVVVENTLLKASGTGDPATCLGDKWASSWVLVDGLGRAIRTATCNGLANPEWTDQVDTCYDELGRKKFVSYPYQGPGFTPESYICTNGTRKGDTFTYDALSRPRTVTNTDGGVIDNAYFSGHYVQITDQAGKKRYRQTDGLGRLVFVEEPDAAGNKVNWTIYYYDPLDNLTKVEQQGPDHANQTNWRIRTFQYDSLSRLTQAVNPESGTITFGYDNDGNLSSKVAPAPNQTGSATVTTNFGYDQLHRLLWKTYSDGPMAVYFEYDQAPPWGPSLSNTVGRQVAAIHRLTTNGPAVATVTSYDVMGRTLFQKHWNDRASSAPPQQFEYTYNLDGSLKTLKYPSNRQLDYTYNRGQRAVSMVDTANSINYATDASYTSWGAILGMKNGVTGSFCRHNHH